MKIFYPPTSLLILVLCVLSASINAQTSNDTPWGYNLYFKEMLPIKNEYAYYRDKYDDGSHFPAQREQELLHYIEKEYLEGKDYWQLYHGHNPLIAAPSTGFAKLFLRYGGNPLYKSGASAKTPLLQVVSQNAIVRGDIPDLTHQEIIALVKQEKNQWANNLPSNNAIALAKLYISLGADIYRIYTNHHDIVANAIVESLYIYIGGEAGKTINYKASIYDKKHFADNISASVKDTFGEFYLSTIEPFPDLDGDYHIFYRSPVTYWLEEFIEKDYPASMLDTHKLHYPRFMKEASVAEVMDMLNNSDAHKISANINCPYQRKQGAGDEVAQAVSPAELCPLVPSVNMRDAMGRTPLHIAGEQGNQAVFNALINIGADESIKDYRGNLAKI